MEKFIRNSLPQHNQVQVYLAEDCVIAEGRCICHEVRKISELLAEIAEKEGLNKVFVLGDCDDHHNGHEAAMKEVMDAHSIEHVWFPEELTLFWSYVEMAVPGFSTRLIRDFTEVKTYERTFRIFAGMGRIYAEVTEKVERDKKLLEKYPVIGNVQAVELHCRYNGNLGKLFKSHTHDRAIVHEGESVALFSRDCLEGVLVTEKDVIPFTVSRDEPLDLAVLQGRSDKDGQKNGYTRKSGPGSIRIVVGKDSEVSLYCFPGVWRVVPHEGFFESSPDWQWRFLPTYEPMWKRLAKAASQG